MSVSCKKFLFPASKPDNTRDISLVWSRGAFRCRVEIDRKKAEISEDEEQEVVKNKIT